jgi:L-arabinokinase
VEDARWRGYLANLTPDEFAAVEASVPDQMVGEAFLARYNGITDTVTAVRPHRTYSVRRAAAHPVHERARVERFLDLLAGLDGNHGNAVEMGELMYGSHAAYSACGLGSSGTDRLVEMVRDVGPRVGLFGAKITGGGSGGTVAVLGTEEARVHVERIAARYRAESGRGGEVFAGSAPGAIHTGVLALAEGWPSLRPGDP